MEKTLIKEEIEILRERINALIEKNEDQNLLNFIKLSKELDELILKYLKNQNWYNLWRNLYEKFPT